MNTIIKGIECDLIEINGEPLTTDNFDGWHKNPPKASKIKITIPQKTLDFFRLAMIISPSKTEWIKKNNFFFKNRAPRGFYK